MNIKQVGKRGLLFTFYELKNANYDCVTNVYVINGKDHFFICDTYLGPFYMKIIKDYLETNFGKKEYIIFNSHSHWDHIWGNCDSNFTFHEEGIEFFYSPGHSEDSASCYDYIDNTLFVGDNIDDPIPSFICWNELEKYRDTLDQYMNIGADTIVQSHGDTMTNDVLRRNKEYLDKLISNEKIHFESEEIMKKHLINIEYLNQY